MSAGTFTSVSICIDDGHGGMFDEVCMMMIMTMMLLKFFFRFELKNKVDFSLNVVIVIKSDYM